MLTSSIVQNLGKNLIFLRKSRGFTQGQLAQASGIPRTTLSYIESGKSNPSLKTLLQLAAILGVTLEELLMPPRPSCTLIRSEALKRQSRKGGEAEKITLLPDPIPGLQFERISLKPQVLMIGTPHSKGTKEYFTCIQGRMALFIEGQEFILEVGDVLAFPGDRKHSYRNLDQENAQGISIVVFHAG